MMMRQMPSTVSSGSRPRCRSASARIIEASRAGRKAEPPPWRALIAISRSMIRPRSISKACIDASIRSISTRRSPSVSKAAGSDTARDFPKRSPIERRPFLQAPRRSGYFFRASGVHRLEETGVGLGLPQLPEQEFDCVDGAHRIENTAQHIHFLENVGGHQQLLLARSRARDVHRRERALVGHLA